MLTIDRQLKQFGLTENEVRVYLEVLNHGKVATRQLPALTHINRTTVYSIAKKLTAMGLVSEDLGGKVTYLVALPPQRLHDMIKKEQEQIDSQKKVVDELVRALTPLQSNVGYSVPKIRFVDEAQIDKHLYDAADRWNESMMATDRMWWGFQDHTFAEQFQKWIDWYWKRTPEEIGLKLLSNRSTIESKLAGKYKRRAMKFWNKSDQFTSTIWVTGDFVTMLSLRERPHYLVEIHDPVMARNMRALFGGLWEEIR